MYPVVGEDKIRKQRKQIGKVYIFLFFWFAEFIQKNCK